MTDTGAAIRARAGGLVTPRTLADLDYKLEIFCRGCRRVRLAEPYELRRMFPKATPLPEALKKLCCKECGAKDPQTWVWVMGWTREKGRRR